METEEHSTVASINELIGSIGWWQLNIASFYFVAYVLSAFNNLGIAFHSAKTDYRCLDIVQQSINRTGDDERCHASADCQHWSFNNSINFDETITSAFQLTCDREWLASFSQSIYQLSYVFSGIIIGYLSDTYGRYFALFVAIIVELIGGFLLIVSGSIYFYILSRFLLGFGDSGRGVCLYMLVIETVGPKHRTDAILGTSLGWVVGYLLLPLVAYLVGSFRYLQLFPTLSMLLLLIVWFPTLTESPRWLIMKEKYEKAKEILIKAAEWNGLFDQSFNDDFEKLKSVKENIELIGNKGKKMLTSSKKKRTIFNLLNHSQYRHVVLILWFSFFANGFIYHGFSLNVDIIGGNVFLNFALAGLMELPSMIINIVGMRYVGRRIFIIVTISLASLCYFIVTLNQTLMAFGHYPVVIFTMLGKLCIFSTYNAIYIHAGEIFPTSLRHTGVSSCSIASRLGSTLAPFVREFTLRFNLTVTMCLFASLALITAFLSIFLPETKDKELVDRVDN